MSDTRSALVRLLAGDGYLPPMQHDPKYVSLLPQSRNVEERPYEFSPWPYLGMSQSPLETIMDAARSLRDPFTPLWIQQLRDNPIPPGEAQNSQMARDAGINDMPMLGAPRRPKWFDPSGLP